MDDKWLGWAGLIVAFVIFQVVRAVLRGAVRPSGGMARLNAAAERILKARGASVANPIPRSTPPQPRAKDATGLAARHTTPLPKSTTPAVIRRTTMMGGGREPVIQRRR